mmetsp:Transcript_49141/g.141026  ORF Transcript_49141/g.141026 Transcript_49141/m.141026 type:complete len:292 (-) Transcript_49141:129-1004(-)
MPLGLENWPSISLSVSKESTTPRLDAEGVGDRWPMLLPLCGESSLASLKESWLPGLVKCSSEPSSSSLYERYFGSFFPSSPQADTNRAPAAARNTGIAMRGTHCTKAELPSSRSRIVECVCGSAGIFCTCTTGSTTSSGVAGGGGGKGTQSNVRGMKVPSWHVRFVSARKPGRHAASQLEAWGVVSPPAQARSAALASPIGALQGFMGAQVKFPSSVPFEQLSEGSPRLPGACARKPAAHTGVHAAPLSSSGPSKQLPWMLALATVGAEQRSNSHRASGEDSMPPEHVTWW